MSEPNYTTEKEARQKICPFIRNCMNEETVYGKEQASPVYENIRCAGSRCMAWRESGADPEQSKAAEAEFRKTGKRTPVDRLGYCGMVKH